MQKIDAHVHFWNYDEVKDSWITEEMQVIRRNFLPEDLAPLLKQNGFDGCVAVQADQSEAENDFLLGLAELHPFIKAVVGWVDLQAENIEATLEFYCRHEKLKGFRHILQGETDKALMLTPAFKRGIKALEKFNYTYDVLIRKEQLPYAATLVKNFPEVRFVLDHLAKPAIKDAGIHEWASDIRELALNPNVCCKVSGMVTEASWSEWKQDDFVPYLDVVFEAFGISRLMYGSDWPVCTLSCGYSETAGIVSSYLHPFSENEKALFWGGNAYQFYNIGAPRYL